VVGNRAACLASGIPHLIALATPAPEPTPPVAGLFQSPWERTLHDRLRQGGVATISQYPVLGYRLDLGIPDLQIDIEVDGEQFHRDPVTGRRKAEDLWRDLTLQGAGWHVIRFWVFELRENLDKCMAIVDQACIQRRQTVARAASAQGGETQVAESGTPS
jgi:very-short-patch-repair endonuclease